MIDAGFYRLCEELVGEHKALWFLVVSELGNGVTILSNETIVKIASLFFSLATKVRGAALCCQGEKSVAFILLNQKTCRFHSTS
jgi:hypothetical protein